MAYARQTARYPVLHENLAIEGHNPDQLCHMGIRSLGLLSVPGEETVGNVRRFNQRLDFHPIGHLAQVLIATNDVLRHPDTLKGLGGDWHNRRFVDTVLLSAALHDVGENSSDTVKLRVVNDPPGDIGVDQGKNAKNRSDERAILDFIVGSLFGRQNSDNKNEFLDDDLIDNIVRFSVHEIDYNNKLEVMYHGIMELAHEINTVKTAILLHKISKEECLDADDSLLRAVMEEVAVDSLARSIRKHGELRGLGLPRLLRQRLLDVNGILDQQLSSSRTGGVYIV